MILKFHFWGDWGKSINRLLGGLIMKIMLRSTGLAESILNSRIRKEAFEFWH